MDEFRITFGDLLDRQVERYGDREFLVHVEHGRRYTFAEFRAECDRVARGLISDCSAVHRPWVTGPVLPPMAVSGGSQRQLRVALGPIPATTRRTAEPAVHCRA